MTDKECISQTLQLMGRIILENGGEAYRVEDTVERMGQAFGLKRTEVYSVNGCVILSIAFVDGTTETHVVRCKERTIHLEKVDMANRISRDVVHLNLPPKAALTSLQNIHENTNPTPVWVALLAAAISAGGFCVMFDGSALDAAVAMFTSALVRGLLLMLKKRNAREMVVSSLLCAFISTLLPQLIALLIGKDITKAAMAGALMQLLPGLAMTNAVQDLLKGDITSGLGNAVTALLTAVLVAGGAMAAGRLILLFT